MFLSFLTEQIESLHSMHQKQVSTESGVSASHSHSGEVMEPHSVIGVALVLGFIFMLLIDQLSSSHGRIQTPGMKNLLNKYICMHR